MDPSGASTWASVAGVAVAGKIESSLGAMGPWVGRISVIPDPRIEEAVGDVRDQVERDDEDCRDKEVGHHLVEIELGECLDEPVADAVEREDRLGDDGAAQLRGERERRDRRQRDQSVPDDVPADEPPFVVPVPPDEPVLPPDVPVGPPAVVIWLSP